MNHQFIWFELASDDMAKAKRFYEAMFGWKMNEANDYVMIKVGAAKELGAGIKDNPGKGKISSHWTPYVTVENTKAATAKATKLGAKVLHDTHETPNGIVSIILDPTGSPLALWSPLPKK